MIRMILILALLAITPHAFAAASIFTVPSTDQSMFFLGELFGPVGNIISGNPNNPLLLALGDFNSAVLGVGGFIILYALIVSTLNTAHDGEMLGKKWNSVWIPMRMAGGFAALLPVKAGGAMAAGKATLASYSLIQIFIMWIVVQGVGAADYVWAHYLENTISGQARPQAIDVPETTIQQAANAFQNAACMYAHVDYVNKVNEGVEGYQQVKPKVTFPTDYSGGSTVSWGTINPTAEDICGSASLKTGGSKDKKEGLPRVSATMLASLTTAAQQYVKSDYCSNNTNMGCISNIQRSILNAANTFVQSNLSYTTSFEGNEGVQQNLRQAQSYGWLYTGAYYMLLSKVGSQTSPALITPIVMSYNPSKLTDYATNPAYQLISRVATICPGEGISSIPMGNQSNIAPPKSGTVFALPWKDKNNKNMQMLFPTGMPAYQGMPCIPYKINTGGPASTMNASYSAVQSTGILRSLVSYVNSFFRGIFDGFVFLMTDTRANPIVSLAQFGQGMVAAAGTTFVLIGVGVSVAAGVTGWVPFIGNATVGAVQVGVTWFAPVAAAAVGLTMAFCGLVGYYLPLIPYVLFTVGAVAWFALVIEAMIAGPIIALGVIHPEGQHDIWGRSEKGVMLLLSIFLRPVLMVIGFIAASLMIYIIIELINGGFKVAFTVGGGVFGPFALFFTIGIYSTILVFLFQRAFALIYEVPDKVLRWIGEAPEQMSEAKETLQKAEHGAEKGMGALQEAPGHSKQGVGELLGDQARQKEMGKTINRMNDER